MTIQIRRTIVLSTGYQLASVYIDKLQKCFASIPEACRLEAHIEISASYHYDDPTPSATLIYYSPETAEEQSSREARARLNARDAELRDRATLAKLLAKYKEK